MTLEAMFEKTFNYGLPTTLLALVLYGLWRAIAWIGPNFLTPIKDQIVIHLAKLDAAIDAMMKLMEGQTAALDRQSEVLTRVEKLTEESMVEGDSHSEMLKRIDENVQHLRDTAERYRCVAVAKSESRDLDHG